MNLREKTNRLDKWKESNMSLVEFTRDKDFSYTPGDIPHTVINSTNAYAQIAAYDTTSGATSYISFSGRIFFGRTTIAVTSISEPLIPETKIPVYRIAALLDGGMTAEEVLQDFPSLSHDKIQYAKSYAADNPNYWRAYPSTSFKRRLREVGFYDAMKRETRRKT